MIQTQRHLKIHKATTTTIYHHLGKGDAISLWRLPHTSTKNLIASSKGVYIEAGTPIANLKPGFMFAPFDSNAPFFFLEADIFYEFEEDIASKDTKYSTLKPTSFYTLPILGNTDSNKKQYLELVMKSIKGITDKNFQKVVPSRRKIIHLPEENSFDLLVLFEQLCVQYPHAFVSLVSTPEVGTWVGASPELLISQDKKMQFRTTALASTQALPSKSDLKTVSWTQKEIAEQALVSQYITECFQKAGLEKVEECVPKTWRAGNLLHLKTDFKVDTLDVNRPQLQSIMLQLLHPTPSVCGTPKEEAKTFLKANECFDRQFYSGYLGPVNRHESHIYVNLRCMQWAKKAIMLYAGAGVTIDSTPQQEWEETKIKMDTLLCIAKQQLNVNDGAI